MLFKSSPENRIRKATMDFYLQQDYTKKRYLILSQIGAVEARNYIYYTMRKTQTLCSPSMKEELRLEVLCSFQTVKRLWNKRTSADFFDVVSLS